SGGRAEALRLLWPACPVRLHPDSLRGERVVVMSRGDPRRSPLELPCSRGARHRRRPLELPCSRGARHRRRPLELCPVRVAPDTVAVPSNSALFAWRPTPSPSPRTLPCSRGARHRRRPLELCPVRVAPDTVAVP